LKEFEPYLARLRVLIHKSKAAVGTPSNSTDADEAISKLERLAALHQTGALTDEEFKVAKEKLLGL
jgi:multidrug resistance efflux pump